MTQQPEQSAPGITYAAAGVDTAAGDRAVALMKDAVAATMTPAVVGGVGGFAGLVDVSALRDYRRPLLATSTDGVGTKVAIAQALDIHDTIGQDLVGMVVDDIVVVGARPLLMTDYIACGRVVPERIADIVRGVAAACAASGWTPNFVSFVSVCFSAIGLVALVAVSPAWWSGLIVGLALAVGFMFDSADGQVSRVTGASSKTGEWVDHVADAFRSPAIHFCTAIAVMAHLPESWWLALVALAYGWVTSGQFMSQILAEQFVRAAGRKQTRGGNLRSFILLPTDPGTLCWSFVLWGLAAGMWLPSSASIGIATSLVSLFAFIGNAFMPLSHTLLTISRFTPMYGATALARWPLGEGWAYVPDRQAGVQDPLWMPLANLVVWTLIFGLLVIGARRRATRRR